MTKPIPFFIKDVFCLDQNAPSGLSKLQDSGVYKACGWREKHGYWKVRHKGIKYYAHRICYYLHTGVDPVGFEIDHIDGDTTNNSPCNLRAVTVSENQANQKLRDQNTSGYKGVHWKKSRNKWVAQVTTDGAYLYLGLFDTPEEAADAYDTAAIELFGDHAKPNSSIAHVREKLLGQPSGISR